MTCAIRTLATVEINDITFSCILVKNLHVDSRTMPIPRAWENYRDNWIEQDNDENEMLPQILIGSDRATLFPRPVIGLDNKVVETNTARLLKSVVSGKFLAHGFELPAQQIEWSDDEPIAAITAASVQSKQAAGGLTQAVDRPVVTANPTRSSSFAHMTQDIITMASSDSETSSEDGSSCPPRYCAGKAQVHYTECLL